MMRISLVIPAYNGASTLSALLDSVEAQDLPADQFEVILVDDGSTDRSADVARRYPRLQLMTQENRGPGAARNCGTRAAEGDIIAYTDADCILPPDWLEKHVRLHEQYPELDGLCGGVGPARCLPYGSSVLADHLCSWFNAHNHLSERTPEYLWSANMSIKRRVVESGIGWSERRVTGEDVDFSKKMAARGMKLRFFPMHGLTHVDRATLGGFLRHQYNWGFHAPFVRGTNKDAQYALLFPANVARACLCSPLIIMGYTALVMRGWWRSRPLGLLSTLPLILLGTFSYVRGVLAGTRALLCGPDELLVEHTAS